MAHSTASPTTFPKVLASCQLFLPIDGVRVSHFGQKKLAVFSSLSGSKQVGETFVVQARRSSSFQSRRGVIKAGERISEEISSGGKLGEEGSELAFEDDWFVKNSSALRTMPLALGATGGTLTLINRIVSGIPAVADAGSAQARADVICLALAATLLLTGLSWLSLQPRRPVTVDLEGRDLFHLLPSLPRNASAELSWAWSTLQSTMRCRSLLVVYHSTIVLEAGVFSLDYQGQQGSEERTVVEGGGGGGDGDGDKASLSPNLAEKLLKGSVCTSALKSGKASYLANLALFPGRFELFNFFPQNTQAIIVEPLGDSDGVLIAASDTVRGFAALDQVWISTIAQKIDSSLQSCEIGR